LVHNHKKIFMKFFLLCRNSSITWWSCFVTMKAFLAKFVLCMLLTCRVFFNNQIILEWSKEEYNTRLTEEHTTSKHISPVVLISGLSISSLTEGDNTKMIFIFYIWIFTTTNLMIVLQLLVSVCYIVVTTR